MLAGEWVMTVPRLTSERRRALELLASSPEGVNEELLVLGHGFKRQMLVGLVRFGLAAVEREVMTAGSKPIEVVRIRINERGVEGDRRELRANLLVGDLSWQIHLQYQCSS
jgi:hypothetical protein